MTFTKYLKNMEKLSSKSCNIQQKATAVDKCNSYKSLSDRKRFSLFCFFVSYCRVTILKNDKRQSRGVAFLQFLQIEDAESCTVLNNTEVLTQNFNIK